MEPDFSHNYNLLYLRVYPVTLKVSVEACLVGNLSKPDRAMEWLVRKVLNLPTTFNIPSNFYQVSYEIPDKEYCCELAVTFETMPFLLTISETVLPYMVSFWSHWIKPFPFKVSWFLFSDTSLSVHQIDWLVGFYGESLYPLNYSKLVRYNLVGVWKGKGL